MVRLALLLVATCALALANASPSVINASLQRKLAEDQTVNVAIILKSGVNGIYDAAFHKKSSVRGQRMTAIREQLIQHTASTQKALIQVLDSQKASYKTFWITNRIIVNKADLSLVQALASYPEVAEIREEIVIPVARYTHSKKIAQDVSPAVVRGVFKVRAHELWAEGFTGEGIITSNVDTGVRGTHRILKDNFRGDYGWFDPGMGSAAPNDQNGHGTHTMGTIAGQVGYGVAGNSTWMACKGCAGSSCSESDLLGCGEFIACPTMTDGTMPDCSKAPHVVGNSWGSSLGGQDWYDDAITAWHANSIIPVFSAGNAGSSCQTGGSPGDRDVISVAATDMDDEIAYFSSRGPGSPGANIQKPEISAPGVEVLSSYNTNDEAFAFLDGTSMASPHVTGGIALLIHKHPSLIGDYQAIRDILFAGAEKTGLTGSNQNCGSIGDGEFPNYVFGWGRLDLVASSEK